MKLYLIRHGETEFNKHFKFIGRTDAGLSEKGLHQARAVADQLKDVNIKAVYSSDKTRAVQTAEIIAAVHGLEVNRSDCLKEIDFGRWEGLTYDEIMVKDSDLLQRWIDDPVNEAIPDGETWDDFRGRVIDSVNGIIDGEREGCVVVVTHGGPIKLLVSYFKGEDKDVFKSFWPSPGSVYVVEVEGANSAHTSLSD